MRWYIPLGLGINNTNRCSLLSHISRECVFSKIILLHSLFWIELCSTWSFFFWKHTTPIGRFFFFETCMYHYTPSVIVLFICTIFW